MQKRIYLLFGIFLLLGLLIGYVWGITDGMTFCMDLGIKTLEAGGIEIYIHKDLILQEIMGNPLRLEKYITITNHS